MTNIPRDIQSGFRQLLETNTLIDLLLKVDQQNFAAHRCLLGSVSFYFRSLLSQESYADVQSLPIVFTIEGLLAEEMDLLLASLYGALTVEEVAKMGKLESLRKAAHALQCPSVMEACRGVMMESKNSVHLSSTNADAIHVADEDLLVPVSSGGPISWLDDDNIAAYEVTDYAPEASVSEENDLLCHEGQSVGMDGISDDEEVEPSIELVPGMAGAGVTLGNSELVLNLPQDAIRVVNDKADVPVGPPVKGEVGLPDDFLSGIVCLCGRGRSGQPSACHQMSATHRNMRLYACRCPCYRAGLPCNDNCRCKGCRNPHGLNPHMFPPMMKRTKEQKACYCGYKQRPSGPGEAKEQRHCADSGRCMCVKKGRSCSTLCRCRCCRNPRGRRSNEQTATAAPDQPPASTDVASDGSPGRLACRCPAAEGLKKAGKYMLGIFCTQSPSDRDLCRRLGLPSKCGCLSRGRSCSPGCLCRGCSNPNGERQEVRGRRLDIPDLKLETSNGEDRSPGPCRLDIPGVKLEAPNGEDRSNGPCRHIYMRRADAESV